MTEFERTCIKAAMKCFMADEDNETQTYDRGMEILSAMSKPPIKASGPNSKQYCSGHKVKGKRDHGFFERIDRLVTKDDFCFQAWNDRYSKGVWAALGLWKTKSTRFVSCPMRAIWT